MSIVIYVMLKQSAFEKVRLNPFFYLEIVHFMALKVGAQIIPYSRENEWFIPKVLERSSEKINIKPFYDCT